MTQKNPHDSFEISWHYLEFDTILPSSVFFTPSSHHPETTQPPPPECPNLIPYTEPFFWSETRKSLIIWLSSTITLFAGYQAGSYISGIEQMSEPPSLLSIPPSLYPSLSLLPSASTRQIR
jgi:hypothetical protein